MCIDETGGSGGHNNACLSEPFPKRGRGDEDAGKRQGENQSRREAEGLSWLRFVFSLLTQGSDRENSSVSGGSQAGAEQRPRQRSKRNHAGGSKNSGQLDNRSNRRQDRTRDCSGENVRRLCSPSAHGTDGGGARDEARGEARDR